MTTTPGEDSKYSRMPPVWECSAGPVVEICKVNYFPTMATARTANNLAYSLSSREMRQGTHPNQGKNSEGSMTADSWLLCPQHLERSSVSEFHDGDRTNIVCGTEWVSLSQAPFPRQHESEASHRTQPSCHPPLHVAEPKPTTYTTVPRQHPHVLRVEREY